MPHTYGYTSICTRVALRAKQTAWRGCDCTSRQCAFTGPWSPLSASEGGMMAFLVVGSAGPATFANFNNHPPKVFRPPQFFFSGWNRAPARVSFTFLRPHLSKVLWGPQSFFGEMELSLRARALFVDNFPRSRPYPGDPTYMQKPSVSHPRVRVNSHPPRLLHVPITWWWVVDIMMWSTRSWEC